MEHEKRRSPRIDYLLPLKIACLDSDLVTETKNISANGAYCLVDKSIPLMAKFQIIMHVPAFPRIPKRKFHKIECTGAVVRSEPVKDLPKSSREMFGLAIFFSEIKERDKKYLERFIAHCLSHPNPAA